MKQLVRYEDFAKLDLRVGKVVECVRKEESNKLRTKEIDGRGIARDASLHR